MTPDAMDALAAAVLRGETPGWPGEPEGPIVEEFLARCRYHGVEGLLNERLVRIDGWPDCIRQPIQKSALARAMWEMRDHQHLVRMFDAFAQREVRPIVLKGAALGYSLYPDPALRTRGDIDLLIEPQRRGRADEALRSIGFVRDLKPFGDTAVPQAGYELLAENGTIHHVDLHWKVSNHNTLSRHFSYDELWRNSVPLPRLCAGAVGLQPAYALLIACMHRAVQHLGAYYVDGVAIYSGNRLIWLYDIRLLARSLSDEEWLVFSRLAREKDLAAVCCEALESAREALHAEVPNEVIDELSQPSAERTSGYLNGGPARRLVMDFTVLEGLIEKFAFVRDKLFPSASWLREKYAGARVTWLPLLYLRRAVVDGFGLLAGTSRRQ